MAYFPMFMDLTGKNIIVVGAGIIAGRRVRTLLDFGCKITVIAPKISEELQQSVREGRIELIVDVYRKQYLAVADIVVAATDSRSVNNQIAEDAKEYTPFINIADNKTQSTFFFPAIIQTEQIIGGMISLNGNNHSLIKKTAQAIRNFLTEAK